jgi:hypothetical protein
VLIDAAKLVMDPRRAIRASRTLVDLDDHRGELRVPDRPAGERPLLPRVEPRPRDPEDSAEPLDAVDVSVLGDESEAADRIVSWAK